MEERVASRNQVDTAQRAAGRVEQCGSRRRCLRARGQPDMERELRRFRRRRGEDEGRHDEEPVGTHLAPGVLAGERLEIELAEAEIDVGDGRQQRQIANDGDEEGKRRGPGRFVPLPPVPDHQVGREADQAEEEQHLEVTRRQHDADHGEGGEEQNAVEPDRSVFSPDEPQTEDLDKEAGDGDRGQHGRGQWIGQHAPLQNELGRRAGLPGEELEEGPIAFEVQRVGHFDADDKQRADRGRQRKEHRDRQAQAP